MFVREPAEFPKAWEEVFNAGNLGEALSLFEAEALMVAQPGTTVKGKEAIRQVLQGFLGLQGRIELSPKVVIQNEGLALLISDWILKSSDGQGQAFELSGQTADIIRRQRDGRWLLVVDNPYGSAAGVLEGMTVAAGQ